jgi:hypothetical protein
VAAGAVAAGWTDVRAGAGAAKTDAEPTARMSIPQAE